MTTSVTSSSTQANTYPSDNYRTSVWKRR